VRIDGISHYLRKRADGNVVVEFTGGDRYPLFRLDVWGENDEGEFEINARFEDCLGESITRAQAIALGQQNGNHCWWTTRPPIEPVGKLYTVEDIEAIHDLDADRVVYTKQPG
jgi:hypothetical protein